MKRPSIDGLWGAFKNFAIVFSFAINFVLLMTLLLSSQLVLPIKNEIAEPLVDGLHSNFIAMDEATIRATIPVSTNVPVSFPLAIENTRGTVVLAEPVPLNVPAAFILPGTGGQINGTVVMTLPQGTVLPVDISMVVQVETNIPIVLDVPVIIPLSQTELHSPFANMRFLLEPYVEILDETPDTFSEIFAPNS